MKKVLFFLGIVTYIMSFGLSANAEFFETNVNMANFWQKNGKEEQKVLYVATRILNKNKIDKRVPIHIDRSLTTYNAWADPLNKQITITRGLLFYLDSDDELAFILSHEIAHVLDFYRGMGGYARFIFNSKQYEYKADAIGIDLMVKAGYNPIAAITGSNKFFPEGIFDFGIRTSHPKSSKRLMEMYKYISKKYTWALGSPMIHNVNYENFTYSAEKDIVKFKQKEKAKHLKKGDKNLL